MDTVPALIESSDSLAGLRDEFVACANELRGDVEYLIDADLLRRDFAAYLRMLVGCAQGKGLPDGWVPSTTYWYVNGGKRLLGSLSLRHKLTPALEDVGGHIGYVIRPSERGKGHGTRLLALTLPKARALGLRRLLLTTDFGNTPSRKIIERCGGSLESEAMSKAAGTLKARYWIDLR